jgi:hypothetical protein
MDRDAARLPARHRWPIWLSGLMVPRSRRSEWVRKWQSSVASWWALLKERDELTPRTAREVTRYAWKSVAEAARIRFDPEISRARWRQFVRSPQGLFTILGVFLLILGIASSGYSGFRAQYFGLPYQDPGQLFLIGQRDLFGRAVGIPVRAIRRWQDTNETLSGLAAFYLPRRPALGREPVVAAEVTTNFFDVLGSTAAHGRTFRASDGSASETPLVLNHYSWQRRFRGDPRILGRRIDYSGRPAVIVGIMPKRFWALTTNIEAWAPFRIDAEAPVRPPPLVNGLARLKLGAWGWLARQDLLSLAKTEHIHFGPKGPDFREVQPPLLGMWGFHIFVITGGLLVGLALIQLGRVRLRPGGERFNWRYWVFLTAKSFALLFALIAFAIELTGFTQGRLHGVLGEFVTVILFGWALFIACGCTLLWSFHDQRRRCPVCLYRLTMPVTIGSWASALLDPVSTEFVCERGHGSLCVPETQSSASEPDRWTQLDESWRELFTK